MKGFNALSDLLIHEQFLHVYAAEIALLHPLFLVLSLKERVPQSVEEILRLAEQYMEGHGRTITGKTTKQTLRLTSRPEESRSSLWLR